MKILSCYIAGFGKFSNQNFVFQNLTVIKEDNGWGKTTLAAFLRCMLFGMEAGRGKGIETNERARYAPWRGGAYGGSLTFVCGGRQYRVERGFGRTPAQDVARVYDQNNMQSFDFGERAELLGERLFGVNADSFSRSVYVPQGEIETGGLPEDMKTRLLALLSNGGSGETSAERALRKLEEADRALRAKRRPAKGKLDEIDERLSEILLQKREAENCAHQAAALRARVTESEREIVECNQKIDEWSVKIERLSRKNELEAAQTMYSRLQGLQAEMSELQRFFGAHEPESLNVEGIESAVAEWSRLKERYEALERALRASQTGEEGMIRAQIAGCERTLASYDGILAKKGGENPPRKGKKIVPKVTRRMRWWLILSVVVALIGAGLVESVQGLGFVLLIVGGIGMLGGFLRILPRREKIKKDTRAEDMQDEISLLYDKTYAELTELRKHLAEITTVQTDGGAVTDEEYARLKTEVETRGQSIEKFLRNFAFAELYDYRAAVAQLKENVVRFRACGREIADYEARLRQYRPEEILESGCEEGEDISSLKAKKLAWEEKKNEWLKTRSDGVSRAEDLEGKGNVSALESEESFLLEEKERLEKRHRAIVSAKEILLKAKENMASRYLDPVERGCQQYLGFLGYGGNLRFAADGAPVFEEQGAFRALGYYSVGSRELVGLCTRIALVDAVFKKELPVLIFDDPFVNLDDGKTERAKALLKELSKRYQILYLTCKSERKI
ncbi:MAG: AAA family ATPase [Clostridia bacterium]|nr:AAA family ATPase [Clostridia bacterium]